MKIMSVCSHLNFCFYPKLTCYLDFQIGFLQLYFTLLPAMEMHGQNVQNPQITIGISKLTQGSRLYTAFLGFYIKILKLFSIASCSQSKILCYFEMAIYQSWFSLCSIFCPQENTEEALLLLLISESMVSRMCFYIFSLPYSCSPLFIWLLHQYSDPFPWERNRWDTWAGRNSRGLKGGVFLTSWGEQHTP